VLDEDKLKRVMGAALKVDPATLGPDSSADNIKTWDSLQHMNLILALEEAFGVTIPDDEVGNITSYALVRLVVSELLEAR